MKLRSLLIPVVCVSAIQAETNVVDLNTLSVSDTIIETPSTVLGRDEISKLTSSRTVESLLADIAGIDIVRRGNSVQSRGVFLRGFDETRIAVVLNGRMLNGAGSFGGDIIDWNAIPADQIESIEVIRGSKTAAYGSSLAGVIKITTISDKKVSQNRARFVYGVTPQWNDKQILDQSFDGSFSHQNSIGKIADYAINLSHWNSDGFLRNNDVTRNTIGGNVTIHFPADIDLRGSLVHSFTDFGFNIENVSTLSTYDPTYPESKSVSSNGTQLVWLGKDKMYGDRSHWINIRDQYDFSLSKRLKSGSVSVSGFLNDQSRTEYFYAITDTNKLVIERFSKPEDFTGGWKVNADQQFGSHSVSYGIDGQELNSYTYDVRQIDSSYFRFSPEDSPHFTNIANYLSVYAQDEFTLLDTLIDIHAGLRFDRFHGVGDTIKRTQNGKVVPDYRDDLEQNGFSPNIGVDAHFWKNGTLGIDGAYVTRMPNSTEYHFYYIGYQDLSDHSVLKPEKAFQVEGSVSQKLLSNRVALQARAYYYSISDYIRSLMGAQPDHCIYNIDNVNFKGLELEGSYAFPSYVKINANYAYQTTRKEGDVLDVYVVQPEMLSELPEHKLNASVQFTGSSGVTSQLKIRHVSDKQVVDGTLSLPSSVPAKGKPATPPAVLAPIEGFTTVDLTGSVPVLSRPELKIIALVGVANLFDVRYEEKLGFPMPGTTLFMGLDAKF